MPAITLIVPFYKTEKNLFERCIRSILQPKDADIELLIVDDGSEEKYHFITDSFISDHRVQVFHRPHKGVSFARNYGMKNASGTWIMFVDSDDYLENGWYSKVKPYLSNAEELIILNGYKDAEGILTKNQFFLKENIDYGSSDDLRLMVMESALSLGRLPKGYLSYFSLGSPCSRLYKNSFLKKYEIRFNEDITFAEDTLFALDVLYRVRSIIYVDKYLYHYVMHGSSATHRYRPGLSAEMVKFFNAANSFFVENKLTERLELAYMYRAFHEMNRAINLEFFHKDNPKSFLDKHRDANRFVKSEPFCSALEKGIRGEYGGVDKMKSIFIKNGMYLLMTKTRELLTSNRKITEIILSGRTAHR
ncbi:glycosyltransferase family 2 protein [Oribacterium sp. WCC10]|uniref:glycosyltransferase family 2 protein n=1 Tax=Oribacterium sp. WCC10 TaxID=1855343 RepID=UPI0008DF1FAF|nr:glycosyltransferase [Oribacterium sp. WCC10]SFG65038.1 Glycosyltransferase involved in cell wall bisynthesis [Oribacterium sp. WCC10]